MIDIRQLAGGDGVDVTDIVVAALRAGEVTLYFPSGVYILSRTISLSSDRQALKGDGASSRILLKDESVTINLGHDVTFDQCQYCAVTDLSIERGGTASPDGMTAIHLGRAQYATLANLTIIERGTAIHIGDIGVHASVWQKVINCWIKRPRIGILVDTSADFMIENCFIEHNDIGVLARNSSNIWMRQLNVFGGNYGFMLTSNMPHGPVLRHIVECTIEGSKEQHIYIIYK